MTFERGAKKHAKDREFTAEDFDFDAIEQENLGFDELALSSELSQEKRELLIKLLAGRLHNREISMNRDAFTQAGIARRMGGLSQPYISQLENGLVDLVGTVTSYALAAGLKVSYRVTSAIDQREIQIPKVYEESSTTTLSYSLKPSRTYVEA
jgi:hypothetical protein